MMIIDFGGDETQVYKRNCKAALNLPPEYYGEKLNRKKVPQRGYQVI